MDDIIFEYIHEDTMKTLPSSVCDDKLSELDGRVRLLTKFVMFQKRSKWLMST